MFKQLTFVLATRLCKCGTEPRVRIGLGQHKSKFTFSCDKCDAQFIKEGVNCQFIFLDELKGELLEEVEKKEYLKLCEEIEEKAQR